MSDSNISRPIAFIVDDGHNEITTEIGFSLEKIGYKALTTITSKKDLQTLMETYDADGQHSVIVISSNTNKDLANFAKDIAGEHVPMIAYMSPDHTYANNNAMGLPVFNPVSDLYAPHWEGTIKGLIDAQKAHLSSAERPETPSIRVDEPHEQVQEPKYTAMNLAQLQAWEAQGKS